ncbi:MAG: metallophosphoesterase [Labilithrix sp.]|nr:metallophosphoesterase [Labilithrix sp.]MCW5814850.1 metallophosphoesterase [Labilithrix sp.]
MTVRHRVLPRRGRLLVSTDVHGNLEDMRALDARFRDVRRAEPETYWVVLGDVVHAPNAAARVDRPDLYDHDDGSAAIVRMLLDLRAEDPEHVLFVLGNHDHAHVGGPKTRKFHRDEAAALEATLTPEAIAELRALFEPALLAVAAPNGVLLTHGAPDDALVSLAELDGVPLDVRRMTERQARVVFTLLGSYGQPAATCAKMLAQVSAASGLDLRVVVHGHDKSEDGFFYEGGNQVCPVLFGAPRAEKRFVLLDLAARYERAEDLRDGLEILRLHA